MTLRQVGRRDQKVCQAPLVLRASCTSERHRQYAHRPRRPMTKVVCEWSQNPTWTRTRVTVGVYRRFLRRRIFDELHTLAQSSTLRKNVRLTYWPIPWSRHATKNIDSSSVEEPSLSVGKYWAKKRLLPCRSTRLRTLLSCIIYPYEIVSTSSRHLSQFSPF